MSNVAVRAFGAIFGAARWLPFPFATATDTIHRVAMAAF
jgi:hypothetical protein